MEEEKIITSEFKTGKGKNIKINEKNFDKGKKLFDNEKGKKDLFQEKKESSLNKDKSFKQSWDAPIIDLCNLINTHPDFFTLSSCSGRLCMMKYKDSNNTKKYSAEFFYVTHEKPIHEEVLDKLVNLNENCTIWFQQEPVILHIQCRNSESANKMLHIIRNLCSWKKSGIINDTANGVILECSSVESLKTIIVKDGKLLIDKEYIKILVEESIEKFNKTFDKIKKAEIEIENSYLNEFIETINNDWFGNNHKKYLKSEITSEIVLITHKNKIDDYINKWKNGSENRDSILKRYENFDFQKIDCNNELLTCFLIFKIYYQKKILSEDEIVLLQKIVEKITPIESIFFLIYQNYFDFDIENFIFNSKIIHKNDFGVIYTPLFDYFSKIKLEK
jgi:tRNA wybutosine-synthesizing protein 3